MIAVIRSITLILLIVVLIFFFSYSQLAHVRWSEDTCHYSLIHSPDTEFIDLAIFGSSRTMRAVHAPLLAQELEMFGGIPWSVYDLSRQQRGMGHNYVMIKELLENRDVKRVLIEYNISRQEEYHDLFYLKASLSDLMVDYRIEKNVSTVKRLQQLLYQLFQRTSKRWEQALLKMKFVSPPRERTLGPKQSVDCNGYRDSIEPSVLDLAKAKNAENYFKERLNWDFDSVREFRSSYYVNAIVELVREHGAEPIFFHSVGRYTSNLDPDLISRFEERFGAKLLHPDDNTLRHWFADKSYADSSHMTSVGAAYFSKWLAPRLIEND